MMQPFVRQGGESREKEGVPRVVEALQSNLWSDMEFRTQSRPSAPLASRAGISFGGNHSTAGTSGAGDALDAMAHGNRDGAEGVVSYDKQDGVYCRGQHRELYSPTDEQHMPPRKEILIGNI